MPDHRIDQCVKCGRENVEIAAFDLCYACYRSERRARERGGASLMRRLNRTPAALIRAYRGLMLAVETLDIADDGGSGLADWVNNRVEALTEPIHDYVALQPRITLDKVPTGKQRYSAFHQITIELMALGATPELVREVHDRVKARQDQITARLAEPVERPEAKNRSSRSRSRSPGPCEVIPFPPPDKLQ